MGGLSSRAMVVGEGLRPNRSINSDGLGGPLGSVATNIEETTNFSHFMISGDMSDSSGEPSGLLSCTRDQPKVQMFYCPGLITAPLWCSFVDRITKELEEQDRALYEMVGGIGSGVGIHRDHLRGLQVPHPVQDPLTGHPEPRGHLFPPGVHAWLVRPHGALQPCPHGGPPV